MKQVIQLDSAGYFAGVTTADESPLEPGVFLIPGGCIEAAVPDVPEGQRAKWEGSWVLEGLPQPAPEPTSTDDEQQPLEMVAEVTMRQARLALLAAGLLDDVNAALNAIPNEAQRKAALIEWEFSNTVKRDMALVQQLAPTLGQSEPELDDHFEQAAQL